VTMAVMNVSFLNERANITPRKQFTASVEPLRKDCAPVYLDVEIQRDDEEKREHE
jgi:hypothetical protein